MTNDIRKAGVSVCFVGRKLNFGSWRIRGVQVAGARSNWEARAAREIDDEALDRFDVFCFVKVPDARSLERVLVRGKLAVHDVVDWWRQPRDHRKVTGSRQARELFLRRWRELPPFHGHIFACRAMYDDLAPLSPFPTVIYHHHWPELEAQPFRDNGVRVGYEGKEKILGAWLDVIVDACRRHGMEFVSQRILGEPVDIGFAARGVRFGGYLPDTYKSNVKLANCFGAGIPAIMPAVQASYRETATDGVAWFETPEDVDRALGLLKDAEARKRMGDLNKAAASRFTLTAIADQYEAFFTRLQSRREHGLIDWAY